MHTIIRSSIVADNFKRTSLRGVSRQSRRIRPLYFRPAFQCLTLVLHPRSHAFRQRPGQRRQETTTLEHCICHLSRELAAWFHPKGKQTGLHNGRYRPRCNSSSISRKKAFSHVDFLARSRWRTKKVVRFVLRPSWSIRVSPTHDQRGKNIPVCCRCSSNAGPNSCDKKDSSRLAFRHNARKTIAKPTSPMTRRSVTVVASSAASIPV